MNKIFRFQLFLILILFSLFLARCEKNNDLPKDGDGNEYDTIVIASQVWLKENLKTTKYNNGVSIPLVTDNAEWVSKTSAAFCWYNNDQTYKDSYGALYNWYAVNAKLLCPLGYHVPTKEEWITLIDHFGGEEVAGGKLKTTGTIFWTSPNSFATNESGFSAVAGGGRSNLDGTFGLIRACGSWWTSSPGIDEDSGRRVDIYYNMSGAYLKGLSKKTGFSVRCIKDN